MARLPTSSDVTTAPVVRQPGNRAPASLISDGGLGAIADVTAGLGAVRLDEERRALEKQQALRDGTAITEGAIAFGRDAMTELTRLRTEGDFSDPQTLSAYQAFVTRRTEDALKALPQDISPEAREELRLRLMQEGATVYQSAEQYHLTAVNDRASLAWGEQMNVLGQQASLYPDALDDVLSRVPVALDPFRPAMTAAQEQENELNARAAVIGAAIDGAIVQGNFDAARSVLEDDRYAADIDPAARDVLTRRIQDKEEQARRIAEAERQAAVAVASEHVDRAVDLLLDGYEPAPAIMDTARQAATLDPALGAKLAAAEALIDFRSNLAMSPPVAVQQSIASIEADIAANGATEQTVAALELARSIQTRQNTVLADDPLAWGIESRAVKVDPVDPANPASIAARVGAATVNQVLFGVTTPPFTNAELDAMSQRWREATPEQRVTLVDAMVTTPMPADMRAALLDKVTDTNPMIGYVAGLVGGGGETVARDVLAGDAILSGNADLRPTASERQATVESVLGNALPLDRTGTIRQTVLAAADAIYASKLGGAEPEGGFDGDLYEEALLEAVGGTTEVNGRTTFLPRGMDEDAFDTWLDGLDDTALHASGEGPHFVGLNDTLIPMTADQLRDDAQLVVMDWAGGEYAVVLDYGGGDLRPVVMPDGRAFVLKAPTP